MADEGKVRPSEGSFSRPSTPENKQVEKKQEQRESPALREASDVGKAAYAEALGMDESAETIGKVSEVLSTTKEGDKGGGTGSKATNSAVTAAQIKERLLKTMPSEQAMKAQIEREIKNEVNYLHKKAMKMIRSPGSVSYFEMNNLMGKIRELKGLLLTLLKASFDSIKTLWLRYVHGIM